MSKQKISNTYRRILIDIKSLLGNKEKMHFIFISYTAVFIITYLFYNSILFSLISFVYYPLFKKPYLRYIERQRIRNLRSQFRDLLYSISASFAAGRQMTEALLEAKDTLEEMYPKGAPIVSELSIMTVQLIEAKETEERVLIEFASRCKIPDINTFVDVYVTCRSTGGNLEKAILRTVKILLEKMEIQEDIRVMTSQKKLEGKIITSLPFLIIILLRLTSPSYLAVLYETSMGRVMMTGALILIYFAYLLIEKITTIEV